MRPLRIGIIGGGAAGMMAAMTVKECSPVTEVILFEKNPGLGAKVIISGGGRCNVTTGVEDVEEVLKRYPRGSRFLKHAMHTFPPTSVYEWFEKHGVKLKTEKDMRVFPVSDNGHDIVGVFEQFFSTHKVDVRCNTSIKSVLKKGGGFMLTDTEGNTYKCDKLIITTGGVAYRHTGSTGDGYTFAQALGHRITEIGPSLTSFVSNEPWCKTLAGVSHLDAEFHAITTHGEKVHFRGPFVWTHKGISGPAVFAMSAMLAFEKIDAAHPLILYVDFRPDINNEEVEKRLFAESAVSPKKLFVSNVHRFVPRAVAAVILEKAGIPQERRNNEVSHKMIRNIVECVKHFAVRLAARGVGDEFVTAGGVDTSEVDPKTMESRICSGLYLAGEILDVDGFTGGYNLQASWATGYLAGKNAARS